jgi:alpha,alpha-trehalase
MRSLPNGTISAMKVAACRIILFATIQFLLPQALAAQPSPVAGIRVRVNETMNALLKEEDTNGDKKITVDDERSAGAKKGTGTFSLTDIEGKRYDVAGVYCLSNLLQELTLAHERGGDTAIIDPEHIFEQPTDHLSRIIRDICWQGLTRRMDDRGLLSILADEKMKSRDGSRYMYVPESDPAAYDYYTRIAAGHPGEKIQVVKVPATLTPDFLRSLDGRHGILTLALAENADGSVAPVPYVVPGGRFNEMYGWDSYFIALGLIADGKQELAKAMVDQHVYEIVHYGKILNANRTYYLTRSQPPFLTSMARAIFETMPRTQASKMWLYGALDAAIREYTTVWMGPDHLTKTGLSRYFDTGTGPCPEVEEGQYEDVFTKFAKLHHIGVREFEAAYRSGRVKDAELDEYFVHDRAMRESGHDTSYRLVDRAADLVTIDLNSLLYKIETDIAELIRDNFDGVFTTSEGKAVRSDDLAESARKRKTLVDRYLWDPASGIYFDYDVVKQTRTGYLSAASLYPLWAGLASSEQAASLVRHALPQLEEPGGIASSSEASRGPLSKDRKERQWDFPNGWPPHQILVWQGLHRYGYDSVAQRLVYRWLYAMTINAVNYNGTITEKLNVVTRSHAVFAEYGNVGTKFSYITREGFGWSNASYEIGLGLLARDARLKLDRLIPPEWIYR